MQVENTVRRPRLTMDELKEVASLQKAGKNASEITEATGIGHQTVLRILGERGYVDEYKQAVKSVTTMSDGKSKMSDEDVLEAVKMLSDGIDYREVADYFGVTFIHINNISRGHARASVTGFDKGRYNILSLANLTDEDIEDIKTHVKDGVDISELSDVYGISSKLVVSIAGKTNKATKVKVNSMSPTHKVKFAEGQLKDALKIVSDAIVDLETEIEEAQKLHSTISEAKLGITHTMGLLTDLDALIDTKKAQLEAIKTATL